MTTLTELRAALQTAPESSTGTDTVPGYPNFLYVKMPHGTSNGSSDAWYELRIVPDAGQSFTVDDLDWLLNDTDTDLEITAGAVWQQSAGADTLWGPNTGTALTVGDVIANPVQCYINDYGPIDVAAGDDYWNTHGITDVPTGYVDSSHIWDGLTSAPVVPVVAAEPRRAATYTYLLVDASTGANIGEIPLAVSTFSRVLNGCGQLSGSLPLDHPLATTAGFEADREITVLRNGIPVWNGPISVEDTTLAGRVLNITAREASWYWQKRVLEVDRTYDGGTHSDDLNDIVRDLWTYFTTKTSTTGDGYTPAGSNIHAAIPRFVFDPATATAGQTRTVTYSGAARHLGSDILADLVADPATGLDYRMNYSAGSTRQQCVRTMTLGSPSLGVTHDNPITESVVGDFTKSEDRERAANRVHTVGSGYTYTLQNRSSIDTLGDILIEAVFDRSDTSDHVAVQNHTRAARLATYPPVTSHVITTVPGIGPFDFGWCDLGDNIYINVSEAVGLLHSVGHRRVTQIDVIPPSEQAPELFAVTVSIPLDTLT